LSVYKLSIVIVRLACPPIRLEGPDNPEPIKNTGFPDHVGE